MNKKIYLLLIWIITLACIIGGFSYHTKVFAKDMNFHLELNNDENSDNYDDLKLNLEKFATLKLDAKVMSVNTCRGDNFALTCRYNKDYLKPSISYENNCLKIEQKSFKNKIGNNKCHLELVIPDNTQLEEIDIEVDVGAVEITNIDTKELDISTNVGAVEISNTKAKELELSSDVGAIEVSDVDFEKADLSSNVGAIEVTLLNPISEYAIEVSSDVGAISVNEKGFKRHYSQRADTGKSLKAKTNVGAIEIN